MRAACCNIGTVKQLATEREPLRVLYDAQNKWLLPAFSSISHTFLTRTLNVFCKVGLEFSIII
jgi:hypothetical protein